MRVRCGKASVLCAIGMAAALMTTSVPAEEAAVSSAESAVESVVEDAAESTAESVAEETAESSAEETEDAASSEAAAAEEEASSDAASEEEADEESGEAEEGAILRPEYRGLDYITLGDYKGLTIEVQPVEITDAQIDSHIESDIHYSEDGSETFEEGTVEEGDVANIDYEGKKDGVAFDGGTAQGYDLEIGSGTFIPGFEEGLVGVAIGDTVDLDLTFPEEYGNEELAGQDVVFTVTVNSVKRYKELDDALAEALSGGEAKTVDEYREQVRAELEESALETRAENAKSQLLSMATENSEVKDDYPQDLIDYYVNDIRSYYESYAAMYGMEFADFLSAMAGITEEDFPEMAKGIAEESARMEFTISAIGEMEELLPEGDELTAAYDALAQEVGFTDGTELIEEYGEYAVNYKLLYDAVSDFLYENAEIKEVEPGSEEAAAEDAEVEEAAEDAVVEEAAEAEETVEEGAESEAVASEAVESETVESEAAESEAAQSEVAESAADSAAAE